MQPIPKLKGRENYNSWVWNMRNYIDNLDLWNTVIVLKDTASADSTKNRKVRTTINMAMEPTVYSHVDGIESAKDIWNKLRITYEDDGAFRRLRLLRDIIITGLEDCESTNDYLHRKCTVSRKLRETGLDMPD